MKKKIITLAVVVLAGIGIFLLSQKILGNPKKDAGVKKEAPLVVGFSLGSTQEERWKTDDALFTKRAEELGLIVKHAVSDNDPQQQISQIQDLIKQGAKVVVVVPSDSEKIAPVIKIANDAGVKIIAYDRLIKNSDLNYYISFDNVKVGYLEAESVVSKVNAGKFAYIGGSPTDNNASLVKKGSMAVLNPKIKKGEINLVIDEFMNNWDQKEAYKTISNYLATGKTLDAVVAANDGTAAGVIQALEEKGLAGKIPVSGQDAELAACQRIIAGTQTSSVYKPIKSLAYKAAEMAFVMAIGREPEKNNNTNNGKIDVPSFLLDPITVNKENMRETIIADNFHSEEDVYGPTVK